MQKHIVLVGMMGSGKSSFGKRLAARLDLPFIDADHELEREEAMSIPEMFAKHGEAWFRSKEKAMLAQLIEGPVSIIATGGGAVLDADTRKNLAAKTTTIWLQAEVPTLLARVGKDKNRPLLQKPDPEKALNDILIARAPLYEQAPIHIRTDNKTFEETLEEIVKEIKART